MKKKKTNQGRLKPEERYRPIPYAKTFKSKKDYSRKGKKVKNFEDSDY